MLEKPEELFVGYVAQKAVIEREGRFLFVKSLSPDAKWDLPGGRLHHNEEPRAGLHRELIEELGVPCTVGELIAVNRFVSGTAPVPFYFVAFVAEINDSAAEIVLPSDELSAYAWLTLEELDPSTAYDVCIEAIKEYAARRNLL